MEAKAVQHCYLKSRLRNDIHIFLFHIGTFFYLPNVPSTTFDKIIQCLYDFYPIEQFLPQSKSYDTPNKLDMEKEIIFPLLLRFVTSEL